MTEAVTNWLAKKGPHFEHDPDMGLKQYAVRCEVPFNTLGACASSCA